MLLSQAKHTREPQLERTDNTTGANQRKCWPEGKEIRTWIQLLATQTSGSPCLKDCLTRDRSCLMPLFRWSRQGQGQQSQRSEESDREPQTPRCWESVLNVQGSRRITLHHHAWTSTDHTKTRSFRTTCTPLAGFFYLSRSFQALCDEELLRDIEQGIICDDQQLTSDLYPRLLFVLPCGH